MGDSRGSWGGYKDYYCKGDKSNSWKSSKSHGTISNVSKEKEFINYLTSIPWRKLLDAQKFKRAPKCIYEWDDSGALESFHTARSRFEAIYCRSEITIPPLPDPDMYIDQVDHELKIDPEVIADIERELGPVEDAELACTGTGFGTSGWDSIKCVEQSVPVSGWKSWGDQERERENEFNNWDKYVEKENEINNEINNWDKYVEKENGYNNWDKYVEKENEINNWDKYVDKENGYNNWDKYGEKNNDFNNNWGNNEVSCSSAWDKWEDCYNNGWNNKWNNSWNNNENSKLVWRNNNELSCSSSWEEYEECNYNNSWNRRNSDWNRRNVRKRDGNVGFRVRKIRFKGEGCSNWRGSRGRNNSNNLSYRFNMAYS